MNEERYNYKTSDINENNERLKIKNLCNEYGFNLGSNRRKNKDIFDECLRLKHFNNEQK